MSRTPVPPDIVRRPPATSPTYDEGSAHASIKAPPNQDPAQYYVEQQQRQEDEGQRQANQTKIAAHQTHQLFQTLSQNQARLHEGNDPATIAHLESRYCHDQHVKQNNVFTNVSAIPRPAFSSRPDSTISFPGTSLQLSNVQLTKPPFVHFDLLGLSPFIPYSRPVSHLGKGSSSNHRAVPNQPPLRGRLDEKSCKKQKKTCTKSG